MTDIVLKRLGFAGGIEAGQQTRPLYSVSEVFQILLSGPFRKLGRANAIQRNPAWKVNSSLGVDSALVVLAVLVALVVTSRQTGVRHRHGTGPETVGKSRGTTGQNCQGEKG